MNPTPPEIPQRQPTAQQRRFVEAYLTCGSATGAARLAGYKWPGKVGSRLLHKPHLRDLIRRLQLDLFAEWKRRFTEEQERRSAEMSREIAEFRKERKRRRAEARERRRAAALRV